MRPVGGGSVALLCKYINVGSDENWMLCLAWLVAALRPTGPYPILVLQGEQGSAKSTMGKILRRIADPAVAPVRTPPRSDRDLVIAASNSWIVAYDNLSGIQHWLSDALCRLATGGGFSTRELYTDSDEVIFNAMRPVILNGIDHLTERADLAERALILHLPRISPSERKDEQKLYADFERDLPQITGALYSALSLALSRIKDVQIDTKPRMADFALWAAAAAPGLFGFTPEMFLLAYRGNRAEAVQETLEGDSVAATVLEWFEGCRAKGYNFLGGELQTAIATSRIRRQRWYEKITRLAEDAARIVEPASTDRNFYEGGWHRDHVSSEGNQGRAGLDDFRVRANNRRNRHNRLRDCIRLGLSIGWDLRSTRRLQ